MCIYGVRAEERNKNDRGQNVDLCVFEDIVKIFKVLKLMNNKALS